MLRSVRYKIFGTIVGPSQQRKLAVPTAAATPAASSSPRLQWEFNHISPAYQSAFRPGGGVPDRVPGQAERTANGAMVRLRRCGIADIVQDDRNETSVTC